MFNENVKVIKFTLLWIFSLLLNALEEVLLSFHNILSDLLT